MCRLGEVCCCLKANTRLEMDLRVEAAAANEEEEKTKNDVGVEVPKMYWEYTSENIRTLDWIDGESNRETEELEKRSIDTKKIASDIIQHFLRHAVRDGFFHAEMQQGNIVENESGQIDAKSCGIMGRLENKSKRFLGEILFGYIHRE